MDSFDVEVDFGKTRDDPYSRRFDEYKEEFDKEIEQLASEYDLRVGRERYAMDDEELSARDAWELSGMRWTKKEELLGKRRVSSHNKELEFKVSSTRCHVVNRGYEVAQ
nr:hypothetical protein [Tanacetum cinerariifolium]